MIRKMEMRSDEMNDETTYLWMDKRPFKDGLPFLNGKMPVYGWINSSLWVDKLLFKDG